MRGLIRRIAGGREQHFRGNRIRLVGFLSRKIFCALLHQIWNIRVIHRISGISIWWEVLTLVGSSRHKEFHTTHMPMLTITITSPNTIKLHLLTTMFKNKTQEVSMNQRSAIQRGRAQQESLTRERKNKLKRNKANKRRTRPLDTKTPFWTSHNKALNLKTNYHSLIP